MTVLNDVINDVTFNVCLLCSRCPPWGSRDNTLGRVRPSSRVPGQMSDRDMVWTQVWLRISLLPP